LSIATTGGAYSVPSDHLAGFKGPYFYKKGVEGKGREGKGREEM